MTNPKTLLFYASFAFFGMLPALNSANATCASLAGVWNFFSLEITPRKDPYPGDATNCTLTIKANGDVTGSCKAWGQSGQQTASMTGKVTLTNCTLSGTLNPGNLLTIRGGYVSGNVGMGIATQHGSFGGVYDAMHFTLAKKN